MINAKISGDINDFLAVYDDMLLQFPPCELKTKERFTELFKTGVYKLFLCSFGYMLILEENITNTIWLDYFAVYKKFHSQGKGSEMLRAMIQFFSKYSGCYLELECPDEKFPDTLRRVKFYEKFGAYNLDMNYFYPAKDKPFRMELFFLPFGSKKPDKDTVFLSVKNVFNTLHSDVPNLCDFLHQISYRAQFPQEAQLCQQQ